MVKCSKHPHYHGEAHGIPNCRACRAMRTAMKLASAGDTTDNRGDVCEVSKSSAQQVKSLEDLVRVCGIDTKEWDVDRWTCTKSAMAAVPRTTGSKKTGWSRSSTTPIVTELFHVKAWLKRKPALLLAARNEVAELKAEALRTIRPRLRQQAVKPGDGFMLELNIPDVHVGKLAWGKETGHEDYDSTIAVETFKEALDALLARTSSYKFDEVVLVLGNDMLHCDTKQGTTTAGTPLDNDSRFHRTFLKARLMATWAIERALTVARVVRVEMVPGNHDTLSTWHLGDSLECLFKNEPRVVINNAPTMRKYVQFGKVMLLFSHGNTGKLADYPLLMATEQPAMWAATRHREAHTGDKHQLKVQEHHGVRVRILPALCPPDAWHSDKHFVGNARSAEAFVWHKQEGLVGTAVYTVPS